MPSIIPRFQMGCRVVRKYLQSLKLSQNSVGRSASLSDGPVGTLQLQLGQPKDPAPPARFPPFGVAQAEQVCFRLSAAEEAQSRPSTTAHRQQCSLLGTWKCCLSSHRIKSPAPSGASQRQPPSFIKMRCYLLAQIQGCSSCLQSERRGSTCQGQTDLHTRPMVVPARRNPLLCPS